MTNARSVKIEKKRRIQDMLQESFFNSCISSGILKEVISVHQYVCPSKQYEPEWAMAIEVLNTPDTQKVYEVIIKDLRKEYEKFIKDVVRMDVYDPTGKRYKTIFTFN